jgi:hypothetical protein
MRDSAMANGRIEGGSWLMPHRENSLLGDVDSSPARAAKHKDAVATIAAKREARKRYKRAKYLRRLAKQLAKKDGA